MRSILLAAALVAGLVGAGGAAAQEACKATFEGYGNPAASVTCSCPAGAPAGAIYGTGTYTADSDLCTSARHAGVITGGGLIQVTGAPGCPSYPASMQNGIQSYDWGSYTASFVFPILGTAPCAVAAQQPAPQPAPAPQGDALSIMEGFLQMAPPGAFAYGSSRSLGPTAFEMTDVVAKPEPGDEFRIAKLTVENVDIAALQQGGPPSTLKLRAEGLRIDRATSTLDSDIFELLGTDTIQGDLVVDYALDAQRRTFTLNDASFDLPGIGRFALGLGISGVGPEVVLQPEAALFTAALSGATITIEDRSFLSRSIAMGARETGESEQALLAEALQDMSDELAGMGVQPGGQVYELARAIGGWLSDYQSPKGPLTVTLAPAQPVSMTQLGSVGSPDDAARLLNLQVSYAGTRADLPEPQAGMPMPQEGAAGVFTDRDVYQSGETVVVFWSGLPGNQQDWVTVVPAGSPVEEQGQYTYTGGQAEGYFQVSGLAPGEYEARLYYDWPNGGFVIQGVYYFTVQ